MIPEVKVLVNNSTENENREWRSHGLDNDRNSNNIKRTEQMGVVSESGRGDCRGVTKTKTMSDDDRKSHSSGEGSQKRVTEGKLSSHLRCAPPVRATTV